MYICAALANPSSATGFSRPPRARLALYRRRTSKRDTGTGIQRAGVMRFEVGWNEVAGHAVSDPCKEQ